MLWAKWEGGGSLEEEEEEGTTEANWILNELAEGRLIYSDTVRSVKIHEHFLTANAKF